MLGTGAAAGAWLTRAGAEGSGVKVKGDAAENAPVGAWTRTGAGPVGAGVGSNAASDRGSTAVGAVDDPKIEGTGAAEGAGPVKVNRAVVGAAGGEKNGVRVSCGGGSTSMPPETSSAAAVWLRASPNPSSIIMLFKCSQGKSSVYPSLAGSSELRLVPGFVPEPALLVSI
ncbi:hypothetical protein F4821DRAFT_235605 [Hypoxylon rubiginosum]|uniref:Uncharacterized protein n=1 Tax=Hypoxylon rubiginosum TaxID=110542 RepID=A0ACC0D4J2_9PEZI|nr:hypothetical protein F4821DRAFT_235605 [Hypoxylon rubiginosum]